jgi:hypothetical protein
MPYASSTGTPKTPSNRASIVTGSAAEHDLMKRNGLDAMISRFASALESTL